ncbi:MAG: transcription elongation factor GreAB [Trueperaceae bacterium]|nr:MAG: transcription elongation factor GreAB [Trueperaceae bacterium]
MSRAFVKEDASDERVVVPARAPLPQGAANLVTTSGLRALHAERAELEAERRRIEAEGSAGDRARALLVADERSEALEARIASARLAPAPSEPDDEVVVGSEVHVRRDDGRALRVRIVGVDESDPAQGLIAFTAPMAAALLGLHVGDTVQALGTELTVTAVRFPEDDAAPQAAPPA